MSSIPDPGIEMSRGRTWPGVKAVIERRKAELFASQTWRPGCFRCGALSGVEMNHGEAQAWSRAHRKTCGRRT